MAKDRKIDRVILGIQNDNMADLAVLKPYEVKLATHLGEAFEVYAHLCEQAGKALGAI